MATTIHRTVIVQAGGRIEVVDADLPEGATVELEMRIQDEPKRTSLVSLIGSAKGLFASTEEIDDFIRAERDSLEE